MHHINDLTDVLDRIEIMTSDITTLVVDAIVNAANTTLLGGGGVDGAIHRAAGPELLETCRSLGGCPTGESRMTNGFRLPARLVIHTVGPVWHGGNAQEDVLLASCYSESLRLAQLHELHSLAFPAISTGVYRFPKERAAKIALRQTTEALAKNSWPRQVIFCCFSEPDAMVYRQVIHDGDL